MTAGLPDLIQYQLAVQNPRSAFADPELQTGTIRTDPLGMPRVVSGGFALTYQFQTAKGRVGVRCFHRASNNLEGRYRAIAPVLGSLSSAFVPIDFQTEGIRVEGRAYPIIKMPWVEGQQLGGYLASHRTKSDLARLELGMRAIADELEGRGAAHGDLQHGNILVAPSGDLKLIDYDGMFVPQLAGHSAAEAGHVNYQHPMRNAQFDETIDRFSVLAITVAFRALAADPSLWDRYSDGENVLFRRPDLVNPGASELFAELKRLPEVRTLAEGLQRVAEASFETTPRLADFLGGEFKVIARPALATRPALTVQYRVVDAVRREALMDVEGEVVTVVGQVVGSRLGTTYRDEPYMFVNFGDWRDGTFTLVLWAEALAGVEGKVQDLKGRWISYTGLVSVYNGRTPARPQMIVDDVLAIRILTADDAEALKGATWQAGPSDARKSSHSRSKGKATHLSAPTPVIPSRSVAPGAVAGVHTPRARRQSGHEHAPTVSQSRASPAASAFRSPTPPSTSSPRAGQQLQPQRPTPSKDEAWQRWLTWGVAATVVVAVLLFLGNT